MIQNLAVIKENQMKRNKRKMIKKLKLEEDKIMIGNKKDIFRNL